MKMQGVFSRAVGSVSGAHCLLSGALTSSIQASVGGPRSGQGLCSLAAPAASPRPMGRVLGRGAGGQCPQQADPQMTLGSDLPLSLSGQDTEMGQGRLPRGLLGGSRETRGWCCVSKLWALGPPLLSSESGCSPCRGLVPGAPEIRIWAAHSVAGSLGRRLNSVHLEPVPLAAQGIGCLQ